MFKKKTIFLIIILISSFIPAFAETVEVPFTLDDRDRLIRLEVEQKALRNEISNGISSLRNEMNTRFESVDRRFESQQKQIDHIITLMYFILGAIVALFGYLLYDRRTTLYPIKRKTEELEEKNTMIINVLKKQAKGNKELSEILKLAGVL